jgi:hypothetical protein
MVIEVVNQSSSSTTSLIHITLSIVLTFTFIFVAQNIENLGEGIRDVYKKMDVSMKAETAVIEANRVLGDSFKEFGLKQINTAPVLSKKRDREREKD